MAEPQPSKLVMPVRSRSPAPTFRSSQGRGNAVHRLPVGLPRPFEPLVPCVGRAGGRRHNRAGTKTFGNGHAALAAAMVMGAQPSRSLRVKSFSRSIADAPRTRWSRCAERRNPRVAFSHRLMPGPTTCGGLDYAVGAELTTLADAPSGEPRLTEFTPLLLAVQGAGLLRRRRARYAALIGTDLIAFAAVWAALWWMGRTWWALFL